jgi:hypothetical protein
MARAVILKNLPACTQGVLGSVGSPGSCEAQPFGYCLGAYTEARNPDGSMKWSASQAAKQPSAAWLYQWEHQAREHDGRVCPQGPGAKPYADKLVADGAFVVGSYKVYANVSAANLAQFNETMRLGYQHVTRHGSKAFPPGPGNVTYTVTTRAGTTVVYSGTVHVASLRR